MRTTKRIYKNYRKKDPRYRLWASSYQRARNQGLEHSLKMTDIVIPKRCPYLGVELDVRRFTERGVFHVYNSLSLDRVDPGKGYVKGNVQVISQLANQMKSEATVEQLLDFARGVILQHSSDAERRALIDAFRCGTIVSVRPEGGRERDYLQKTKS